MDAKRASIKLRRVGETVYAPEYRIFLKLLKAAREQAGLSQRELALRIGKSYSYVAKVETGYARMDIVQIRLYLDAVGAPFLDFMRRFDEAVRQEGKAEGNEAQAQM